MLRKLRSNPIPIKIIFFDFDGVIVESVEIKNAAFRRLYAEHGEDVVRKVLAHHAEHGGISRVVKIRDCHRMFLGVDLDDDGLNRLVLRYAADVEDSVVACDLVEGAMDLMRADRGERLHFVVSGTPEIELRRITERRDITRYFDDVHGSPTLKEVIVEDILARHGVAPQEALFVGDAMTDYRAAKNTGVPFVGRVADGWTNPFPPETDIVADMTGLRAYVAAR